MAVRSSDGRLSGRVRTRRAAEDIRSVPGCPGCPGCSRCPGHGRQVRPGARTCPVSLPRSTAMVGHAARRDGDDRLWGHPKAGAEPPPGGGPGRPPRRGRSRSRARGAFRSWVRGTAGSPVVRRGRTGVPGVRTRRPCPCGTRTRPGVSAACRARPRPTIAWCRVHRTGTVTPAGSRPQATRATAAVRRGDADADAAQRGGGRDGRRAWAAAARRRPAGALCPSDHPSG